MTEIKKYCCQTCKRDFDNARKCRRCLVVRDISFFEENRMNKKKKINVLRTFATCRKCRETDSVLRNKKKLDKKNINLNSV